MADSSFDIVSKIDRQEVDNALGQTAREIATRFDFKGTGATIEWQGERVIEAREASYASGCVVRCVARMRRACVARRSLITLAIWFIWLRDLVC